jgi:pseudouridylate synthase
VNDVLKISTEVSRALQARQAVVALETTLVAHGFPGDTGFEVARECERRVREAEAVPATIGVVDGEVRVGLEEHDLERFAAAGEGARKVGPRDLAATVRAGELGATTIGGTLAVCRAAGIGFMGTGGLGGVHRGFTETLDISSDLGELARTQAVVVASGVKSLLDVVPTTELLETLGVPVLGFRTATLPLFYRAEGGPPVAASVESPEEAAEVASIHWRLGRHSSVVVANPPRESVDVEPLVAEAVAEARRRGIAGPDVTPFVLAHVHRTSGGQTIEVNRQLVADNAAVAAEIAVAYARIG